MENRKQVERSPCFGERRVFLRVEYARRVGVQAKSPVDLFHPHQMSPSPVLVSHFGGPLAGVLGVVGPG